MQLNISEFLAPYHGLFFVFWSRALAGGDSFGVGCHNIQPIADMVAQHLEIISKNFQLSTRSTRILMGYIIYYLVLIVNPMGRILVRLKSFRNNLEMLCHLICNRLYIQRVSEYTYNTTYRGCETTHTIPGCPSCIHTQGVKIHNQYQGVRKLCIQSVWEYTYNTRVSGIHAYNPIQQNTSEFLTFCMWPFFWFLEYLDPMQEETLSALAPSSIGSPTSKWCVCERESVCVRERETLSAFALSSIGSLTVKWCVWESVCERVCVKETLSVPREVHKPKGPNSKGKSVCVCVCMCARETLFFFCAVFQWQYQWYLHIHILVM